MMNDNDPANGQLAKILESFCPGYTETLQRLTIAQNALLPLKIAIVFGFLVPSSFMIAFRDFWMSGDASAYVLAPMCAASFVASCWGYKSILKLERSMGVWKTTTGAVADRQLGKVGWVFVPLDAGSQTGDAR